MNDRMITRCSHCGTAFRVYAHQLERRAGQVRCGACGEVFDARASLVPDGEPPFTQPPDEATAVPAVAVPATRDEPPARVASEPDALDFGGPSPEPQAAAAGGGVTPGPVADEITDARADAIPDEILAQPKASGIPAPASGVADVPAEAPDEVPEQTLDFGTPPARPERRGLLIGGIVFAAALLLLQALFWFRAELAARVPALGPTLASACKALGCAVALPRRADLITIESSDLQSDGDYLVLVAILRNRANFTQAYPAIELTLTDPRDQPVVRRVLRPADYLDSSARVDTGAPAGAEVLARVYIDASKVNASGYRVFVFHE